MFFYVVLAGFVTLLFFTSHYRHAPDGQVQDFYYKTRNAMERGPQGSSQKVIEKHDHDADGDIDEEDEIMAKEMAERLRLAEQKAKENANAKAPHRPDAPEDVVGVGSSAHGQKKKGDDELLETDTDHEVEDELNIILEKSPIIIFSKSYCPHSKRAKDILLEKYSIEPKPYVVELDLHPLGAKIQEKLAERTGRRTVPNVMIYGVSIGGGDDIAALDSDKELASKIKSLGNRIKVTQRAVEDSKAG